MIGARLLTRARLFASIALLCLATIACRLPAQNGPAGQSFWKGQSGNYNIEWSPSDLRATNAGTGAATFDAAAEARKVWSGIASNAGGAELEAEFTYRLLSVVGPYLSFEETVYCDCGGAHPTAVKHFRTIDLASSAPAQLTTFFPDRDILAALLADPLVTRALDGAKPNSLPALLNALADGTVDAKDCDYRFPDDLFSSFAFYDVQNGNASVRISLPNAAESCRGQMIQLGLSLAIPEAGRAWLADAKEQHAGLLMIDALHNGHGQITSIRFRQAAKARP
jgi:hypothetical protein